MRISGLFIYPIKGCRGIPVDAAPLTRAGLAHDRRYMLADAEGKFLSQRSHPALSQVRTSLEAGTLRVGAPGAASLELPLFQAEGPHARVQVWRDAVEAIEASQGSSWFTRLLGEPVRLVWIADDALRATNPLHSRPGDVVGFADAYPLLAVGDASLEDLNRRIPAEAPALSMARFRPNLTLGGLDPFAEDDFSLVEIAGVTFRRAKLCERCVVTTLNPEDGTSGPEPLRTLASFRRWDRAVWFGANWIPDGEGMLRVGDAIAVLERSPVKPEAG